MPFEFRNLDEKTRSHMVKEIQRAGSEGNQYYSKRFNEQGHAAWPELLLEAARTENEHWLAYQLEARRLMKGFEGSATPSGGYTIKHVPHTAAETMADGQFNRYYMLGLCERAIEEGIPEVTVYRAKAVAKPRSGSEELIGQKFDPAVLAGEIRPVQSSLGHPLLQPNSGLSIHL